MDQDADIFSGIIEALPKPALFRAADKNCPASPKPYTVSVTFDNRPPVFFANKTSQQLGQMQTSTVFSHGTNEVFVTGGITSSNITSQIDLATATLSWQGSPYSCLYPGGVKVTITYAPEVYIARGYATGSCRYQTTAQHEMRHVNTDVITLKEFTPWVEAQMKTHMAALPAPLPQKTQDRQGAEKQLMAGLQGALTNAMNTLNATRMARQQLIDTRQEYLRLSKACAEAP